MPLEELKISIPDGLSLMPFQKDGIKWAAAKISSGQSNILIADDMGLGKTVQALGILNSFQWKKVLVICPASLRLNWKREAEKWLIERREIAVVTDGKFMPDGELIVCNYDLLGKHEKLKSIHWDFIIADECHAIKGKSQRTKHTLALKTSNWIFLTGTPILNRPVEIWNVAHKCDPRQFANWYSFAKRYCDLKETPFGLDSRGASNLGELNQKLSSFMLRRKKADVLKDLPPKRRQIIELPPTKEMRVVLNRENMQWKIHEETLAKLVARRDNAALLNDDLEYREAALELKQAYKVAFAEMAKVRQEVALAKLPLCVAHIKDLLESVDKLVVFCRHKAVAANLMTELAGYNPVVLMGDTAMSERQNAVDALQNDPSCRVFVGSIQAAGVGITLTAAATVVFVEPDWTPALLSQCEDRCYRIGQKNSVLVQHLLLESSLDSHMIKQVMSKQEIIDQAIDASGGNLEEVKKKIEKTNYAAEGRRFNKDQRALLIRCLRAVADKDKDGARQKNGEGFSLYHSQIGKQLAAKWELTDGEAGFAAMLARRYRAQIDAGILRLAGVSE